jgi:hypothetical protein
MNIKRDTLEKRASFKSEFQETPTVIQPPRSEHLEVSGTTAEYTPSVEHLYLPKSLRGPNNNPYSIMNSMTESIVSSSAQQQQQQQSLSTDTSTMELETSVAAAAPVLAVPASETIPEPQ